MKITRVEAIPITMPLRKPYRTSLGPENQKHDVFVKIDTDEDIMGVGEASASPFWPHGLPQRALVSIIEDIYAPLLIGRDPVQIGEIIRDLERAVVGSSFTLAAIDVALYDIVGQHFQRPVYDLLGGCHRERIPLHYPLGIKDLKATVTEAEEAFEAGYQDFKIKVGRPDFGKDEEILRALREALGSQARLRIDANQAWNSDQAIGNIRKLERYALVLVEQPVPWWDMAGMAKIAKAVDTPIMADESVFSPQDVMKIIQWKAADIVNIKLMKTGGLWNAKKIATVCEAAGLSCFMGSMLEIQPARAAALHFAAANEIVRYPMGFVERAEDPLVMNPLRPQPGYILVPKGPGLGIRLDEKKLEQFRTDR